ncbi:beta-lactamase/transpeptidase-like protein [Tricladium varicosporioides]|nr:beta-lactamase/transpeptidase-like protein [Hymenoscyphus varicosporioides]
MASFEKKITEACFAKEIPGVVLLADDNRGNFQYRHAAGYQSPTKRMEIDSTFVLASCTKLPTSIAALQCVERGQISLDNPVSSLLPELGDMNIITGFEENSDEAVLKKAENKITLRHLLTHTSGIGYDATTVKYKRWRKSRGETGTILRMPQLKRISVPLVFEPGTSWEYGYNHDWIGILVERLNDCSLEEYFQRYLWDPLGITTITFHPSRFSNIQKKLVKMSTRAGISNPVYMLPTRTTEKVIWTEDLMFIPTDEDEGGGGRLTGSALDFMKILQSIGANDGKLLGTEMVDEMFKPQLTDTALKCRQYIAKLPFLRDSFAHQPAGTEINHGLGGELVMSDKGNGMRAGTMTWSGLPNLLWSIDREAGLNLFYASQIVPFGDYRSGVMQREFEKEMYNRLRSAS